MLSFNVLILAPAPVQLTGLQNCGLITVTISVVNNWQVQRSSPDEIRL